MAKGDSVTVRMRGFPEPIEITASRGGRTLKVTKTSKYLTVDEMTRGTRANPQGRKTGQLLQVAVADLVAYVEHKTEPSYKTQKGRPVPGQVGLMESLDAGEPTVSSDAQPPIAMPAAPKPVVSPKRLPKAEPPIGINAALAAAEQAVEDERLVVESQVGGASGEPDMTDLPPPLDPLDLELDDIPEGLLS